MSEVREQDDLTQCAGEMANEETILGVATAMVAVLIMAVVALGKADRIKAVLFR